MRQIPNILTSVRILLALLYPFAPAGWRGKEAQAGYGHSSGYSGFAAWSPPSMVPEVRRRRNTDYYAGRRVELRIAAPRRNRQTIKVTKTRIVYSSESKPIFVVAIGGSVGGLAAYKELLSALPNDTGMAFVIVSHLLAGATSHLPEILSHYTSMNVIPAFTGMPILANQVYVNSPDCDLLVERGAFKLIHPRTGRNKDVDRFIKSLANERGARAIAVILSGYDGDGTAGCAFVKAKGGIDRKSVV